MAIRFVIPGPLREFVEEKDEVRLDGEARSVAEALDLLWRAYPGVRDRVVTERGEVRPHVNIFVDGESIRWTGGLAAAVGGESEIFILPALSGG